MSFYLIRHGQTQGNLEGRYIGCRTDESLCSQGIASLSQRSYPRPQKLFVSPMKRCLETASILFPGMKPTVVNDLRECDFGDFENLNYHELNGRPDYQAWIDSGGMLPFPGGESRQAFSRRCVNAFERLANQHPKECCAFVIHGGSIMAIMEALARPKKDYYAFQIRCGQGYLLHPDGSYEMIP